MESSIAHHLHLIRRASFGIRLSDWSKFQSWDSDSLFNWLFQSPLVNDINVVSEEIADDLKGIKQMNPEKRKEARAQSRKGHVVLNLSWLKLMMEEENAFVERMAFFWHGLLACRTTNSFHAQQYLNVIRKNALGNFRTLLLAVSKTPAMLTFLNNQQNRQEHPNENFAREVMELFTLGIGNYTEMDIKEAARAFTGWSFDRNTNAFEFKEKWHDKGAKTIFGKSGNFNGDDVIELILSKKETAIHITKKVWQSFISETFEEKDILELADILFKYDYAIVPFMKAVFKHSKFYSSSGQLVKSPVELLVNTSRELGIEWKTPMVALKIQRLLGQILLFPPNVAGWKGGKNWIDSSSLMLRLQLPKQLLVNNQMPHQAKELSEVFEKQGENNDGKSITSVNWDKVNLQFQTAFNNKTLESIWLARNPKYAMDYLSTPKDTILQMMALPEYQLI
jgi:uncharacterized protein (DUF1800 family)